MRTEKEIKQKIEWYKELMEKECLKPNCGNYDALFNAVQELEWTLKNDKK